MKRAIDAAKNELERAISAVQNILLKMPREQRGEKWQNLYYSHPHAAQVRKTYVDRYSALAAEQQLPAELFAAIRAVVVASDKVLAAKLVWEANKGKRQRPVESRDPRYSFPRNYEPVNQADILPGDYLMLAFGRGVQLAYVAHVSGPVGLEIFRLENRGHFKRARWSESWISRNDWRILGKSSPCVDDPKVPAESKGSAKLLAPNYHGFSHYPWRIGPAKPVEGASK